MPIRLAIPQDELAIATLCTKTFFDENLFGKTIHPHRHEYPEDVEIFWHNWIREDFNTRCARIVVSTNEQGTITGMATWQRQGSSEQAQKLIDSWSNPGDFPPLERTENRALDPSKATILQDSESFFKYHWNGVMNGVPRKENWYLHLCCVAPGCQGKGYGKDLVKWGLDKASEEGVHASVMAAKGAEKFYAKYGYDEIVGNCCDGEENPLRKAGVTGGDILFMWAKPGTS